MTNATNTAAAATEATAAYAAPTRQDYINAFVARCSSIAQLTKRNRYLLDLPGEPITSLNKSFEEVSDFYRKNQAAAGAKSDLARGPMGEQLTLEAVLLNMLDNPIPAMPNAQFCMVFEDLLMLGERMKEMATTISYLGSVAVGDMRRRIAEGSYDKKTMELLEKTVDVDKDRLANLVGLTSASSALSEKILNDLAIFSDIAGLNLDDAVLNAMQRRVEHHSENSSGGSYVVDQGSEEHKRALDAVAQLDAASQPQTAMANALAGAQVGGRSRGNRSSRSN